MLAWPARRRMLMARLRGGHDMGAAGGADLGAVLAVDHVADPVHPVFDGPVTARHGGELGWAGLGGGQRGDRLDGLGGPFPLLPRPGRRPAADDLDGLGGVREGEPLGDGGDLKGAVLAAAVTAPQPGPCQCSANGASPNRQGVCGERLTSQFSYQPSSAITTRIDLMLPEVVAVPARSAPTS